MIFGRKVDTEEVKAYEELHALVAFAMLEPDRAATAAAVIVHAREAEADPQG